MKFKYNLGIIQVLLIDVLAFDLVLLASAFVMGRILMGILGIIVGFLLGLVLLIDANYQLIRYERGK